MKTILFENVGGNQFKLLKESTNVNESLVASGLKKVFMNAGTTPISYHRVEAVGMGYIKDITTAKRVALDEARILAKEYGYQDNENDAKFVKEAGIQTNPETDMSNPTEKKEVQIGEEILKCMTRISQPRGQGEEFAFERIRELANELIKIHGQQS